jgi:hypothetical protein
MTHTVFGRAAVAAVLVVAGLPAKAQIHGGSLTPPVSANELAQRVAAERAEFPSVLANALSPDSVRAMLQLLKEQQNLTGSGITNFDNVNAPCDFTEMSAYSSGGIPRTPELIGVGQNKTTVSLWLSGGSMSGSFMAVVALGKEGVEEMVTTTTSPEWVQIILVGAEIEAVALVGNPLWLVADDVEAQ